MKTEMKDPKLQELQEKLEAKKAGRLPLSTVIWLNPRAGKMKRILRSDWLLKRVARDLPRWSRWKKFSFWPYNKPLIDQACLVKMAGYWRRSFLRFYCRPRRRVGQ